MVHGTFAGDDDGPSSAPSSHDGGSIIATATRAPSAHSVVVASQPAVKPHVLTTAPPATVRAASTTTCTARERASIVGTRFTAERDARAIQERLIGAGPEGVCDRDEEAGPDEAGNALGQPAADHAGDLKNGSEDEAASAAVSIGKPSSRYLERHHREVASRHRRRHERRRHPFLLRPPQEIEAVHDAFDGGDLVRQVEPDVSLVAGSVTRRAWHGF